MIKKMYFMILLFLVGCATVDHSTLREQDSELIEHVNAMILQTSGKGDALLRPLFDLSQTQNHATHIMFSTSFATRRGGIKPVEKSMTDYCEQKNGSMKYNGCILNNNENDVIFFYNLSSRSDYGFATNEPTHILLNIYFPRSDSDAGYMQTIIAQGYKTQKVLAQEQKVLAQNETLRKQELINMRQIGTRVCVGSNLLLSGWVEGGSGNKLQVRMARGNSIKWYDLDVLRICE